MLNSYLELNFEIVKKSDNSRYANGDDIRLTNVGPIALFSIFKLTASSGKHLEGISHAHIVSLMYKLVSGAKDSDDLSLGFDRDRGRKQSKNHLRIMLKDVFGFAEHQEKATYGLGYDLTLKGNKDDGLFR